MRHPVRLFVALLCIVAPAPMANAQDPAEDSIFDIRDVVVDLAFDPTTYFPSPYVRDRSIVRIVYTGDDYGWPVYALAVAEGCVDEEDSRQAECRSRLRARMVRSPAPPDMTRPRQRGLRLVGQLSERGATSAPAIRGALDEMGVEWVEADLRTCPGALSALERSNDMVWVPEAVSNPVGEDELSFVLHADIVQVEFQQYARVSTYRGWIANESPAAWAGELASALEPCWRPAGVPAPWTREEQSGEDVVQ